MNLNPFKTVTKILKFNSKHSTLYKKMYHSLRIPSCFVTSIFKWSYYQQYPNWSSGQDYPLSPGRPGFDSPIGNFFSFFAKADA